MEDALATTVADLYPDATSVSIEGFAPIPGGFSRETYAFDAVLGGPGGETTVPLLLRKDPPPTVAILETSRQVEHDLIETIRTATSVPVSRSVAPIMDPSVFGEAAMILERAPGNPNTSDLFNDGPDADQVDDVIRHLCECLAELHLAEVDTLNVGGALADPRNVGIDISSWEAYMDSTLEYYISSYEHMDYDPSIVVVLDAFLTMRRTKPRALPLSLVHGDFNPANFLYENSRVTAVIDWENSRVGDPREDLGWMVLMDVTSNTSVMAHPADKGGFLAYYNELTGFEITMEELGWFTLFGTCNIAVPLNQALKRRVTGQHDEFLHLYITVSSAAALPTFAQMLGYPGVAL